MRSWSTTSTRPRLWSLIAAISSGSRFMLVSVVSFLKARIALLHFVTKNGETGNQPRDETISSRPVNVTREKGEGIGGGCKGMGCGCPART